MGIFEKNLVMLVLKFVFNWLLSNERNKKDDGKKKD
jgi:RAB protein geranylgeranyltransferase component A